MGTSTVVVARDDLTIPGALEVPEGTAPAQIENEFFKILEQHKADAVVLDLTGSHEQGITAVGRIRRRSAVPIIVVCSPEDKSMAAYRKAGAAACMNPPIDLMRLREAFQQPGQSGGSADETGALSFSGFVLQAREQRLIGPSGAGIALSAVESQVLQHLAGTPGVVWPAEAIADAVDAAARGNAGLAVGPVVARLRKKLASLAGPAGQRLIKTEIGRGYMFAAEVVPAWPAAPPARSF